MAHFAELDSDNVVQQVIVVVEGPLSWWWHGLLVGWLVGCIDRRLLSWYQIEPSTQTINIPLTLSI